MSKNILKFYFSFRSPYSCLGFFRFYHFHSKLNVDYKLIPLAPSKEFTDKPIASPEKFDYIIHDVERIFSAYGLKLKMPEPFDVDWAIPHAAFIHANINDKGLEFAFQMYRARFCEGKNIGDFSVLTDLARFCELDINEIITAHKNRRYQRELLIARKEMIKDKVFGVPTYIYGEETFWGNDRFDWLVRKIYQEKGIQIPDLSVDYMLRPF